MTELLKIILTLSLSGTVLILLLFVCRPVYRNRLSKRWQYYIWLLVIARLLLPVTPETSLTGNLFRQAERFMEQQDTSSSIHAGNSDTDSKFSSAYIDGSYEGDIEPDTESPSSYNGSYEDEIKPDTEISSSYNSNYGSNSTPGIEGSSTQKDTAAGTSKPKPSHRIPENTVQALCVVWLVVAMLLFVHKATVYQSFVKYVTAGGTPVDDIALLERFGQIMDENHVKGTVELCVNDLVSSPLLIGFTHARIILPTTDLSADDFYYTVLHELIHYKRRDMFYKWLVQLTICLHWFNPFVYLMGHEINRACELSCDERVIRALSDKSRKAYGDTLLNAIGTGGSYKDTLASVTLNESKELLKGRLDAIMKYKKIPKAVQMTAVFITGILIGGAAVLGAYAAPTAGNTATQDSNAIDQAPDYRIEYEDGTFYILTGGATEADKPVSGVTNGYHHLILVRKDEYYSFGSWTNSEMQNLVRHITSQCKTSLENGRMTQEDVNIVIAAATEIQEAYRSENKIQETYPSVTLWNNDSGTSESVTLYAYTQSAYYQAPYIIEIGYNLTTEAQNKYNSTLITLSDQSTMPVFFCTEAEDYLSDETAISAITALIERIAPKAAESTSLPLEFPYIVSMEYIGEGNLDSLAERYYDEEMLTYFGAIFLELDVNTQLEYLDHMFEDENISFFACCIGKLEETDTKRQKELVTRYILKAYEEDKVNFFAVLAGELDEETRKSWLEKCKKDGKTNYYYILSDEDEDIFDDSDFMNDDDYSNEWDDEKDESENTFSFYQYLSDYLEEKGLLEEYNKNNIITIKNAYYYQNARVRLLVDVRSDGSFENFNYNVNGTVDLRLLRDKNNKIIRVEYLSAKEAAEIIRDR